MAKHCPACSTPVSKARHDEAWGKIAADCRDARIDQTRKIMQFMRHSSYPNFEELMEQIELRFIIHPSDD